VVSKYGYVIYKGKRKIAEGEGIAGRGKEMTANVAEYVAVLRALEWLRDTGFVIQGFNPRTTEIRVRGDSRLVMQQLGMLCVTKSWRLRPWHRKVRELSRHFQIQWEWIPRAWNIEADARANFKTS
jgi:ribonuclease HI